MLRPSLRPGCDRPAGDRRRSGLRVCESVQLIDPILRELINPQHLFQYLESCQPTPIPGIATGTWQLKRLKPSSISSFKVKILRKITPYCLNSAKKTHNMRKFLTFTRYFFVLDHFCGRFVDLWPPDPPPKPLASNQSSTIVPILRVLASNHQHQYLESCESTILQSLSTRRSNEGARVSACWLTGAGACFRWSWLVFLIRGSDFDSFLKIE